jgi:hypothetical protein
MYQLRHPLKSVIKFHPRLESDKAFDNSLSNYLSDSKYYHGTFINDDFSDNKIFDLENGPWIAGGYVRNKFEDKLPRDVDVYFKDEEQYRKISKFCNLKAKDSIITFNFVKFIFFNSWKDVLESIDFTCCNGITDGKNFVLHKDFHEHNQKKILQFTDTYKHITSPERLTKYLSYGFIPEPNVVSKVFLFDKWKDCIIDGKFTTESAFNS